MKSLLSILAFATILFPAHYIIFVYLGQDFRSAMFMMYAYYVVITFLFEMFFHRDRDPKQFIMAYMGYSGGKMMLSLFVLLIFGVLNRDYLWPFALSFMVLYFAFTGFEIVRLLRYLKK